jgi:hypothetical protein
MDKIKRREFKGSKVLFILLALTVLGIPMAILYLIENTIEIEYEVSDADEVLRRVSEKG